MHTVVAETRFQDAQGIMSKMPTGPYPEHYQPSYPDEQALLQSVQELCFMEPATQPKYVDALRAELAQLAINYSGRLMVIEGNCAERVVSEKDIETLVDEILFSQSLIARSALASALIIRRGFGQNAKPRSSETETLPNDEIVLSYMGDAVNGTSPEDRTPDPYRMVAAARQASSLESAVTSRLGYHMFSAHEALLLPYERAFIREDPETGKKYLLSADLPWVGWRTNFPDGQHIAILEGIENSVAVKLGPGTTISHIKELNERLNPGNEPGKLVFMLRFGIARIELARELVEGIAEIAPGALISSDAMHGNTFMAADGTKTRWVDDVMREPRLLAKYCRDAGLHLKSIHLETTSAVGRKECIDDPEEIPLHKATVDPQLNPDQTLRVYNSVADHSNI